MIKPLMVISVAAGGALGSVARYVCMSAVGHVVHSGFPYGTLAVNILGSFAMGVFVELWALVWSPSAEMRVFLTTGILGGFTTFSTFSLDVAVLMERHTMGLAALYVVVSVVLSVAALFAALYLMRSLLA